MDKLICKAILEAVNAEIRPLRQLNKIEAEYGNRQFGENFEALVNAGYIEGVTFQRADGGTTIWPSLLPKAKLTNKGFAYLRTLVEDK